MDPYFPNRNALLDYPLTFQCVYLTRQTWSKPTQGTMLVDDIVARLLVAASEVDGLTGWREAPDTASGPAPK